MIICGTGHRPQKLGGYSDQARQKLRLLAADYLCVQRPDRFISGMALGWDTALAEAALMLQIPYVAAIPFKGQESAWPAVSQQTFNFLVQHASEVVIVCDGSYAAWKMQKRNQWMVDHSDRVCALFDGSPGGTANCVKYALEGGKPIDNLWPQFCA